MYMQAVLNNCNIYNPSVGRDATYRATRHASAISQLISVFLSIDSTPEHPILCDPETINNITLIKWRTRIRSWIQYILIQYFDMGEKFALYHNKIKDK